MVQLRTFSRSIRFLALAFCSLAIVAVASPASAKPNRHHGAARHAHGHHHIHSGNHARKHHRHHQRRYRAHRRGHHAQGATWEQRAQQLRARGFDNAQASIGQDAAMGGGGGASFGASNVVAEARRYIGGNPTGRSRLWCARFMNMVLEKTGHRGTGSDMARSFAHYGHRVAGPQVGAIAVMGRRGGGHVGVVTGIDPKGNPIVVSGNHGRRVAESVYSRSRIYAYVMPSS